MDEMMCEKPGQKELAILREKADHSGGSEEVLTEKDGDNGLIENWSSEVWSFS